MSFLSPLWAQFKAAPKTQEEESDVALAEKPKAIYCPQCQSDQIKGLTQIPLLSQQQYRYRCLSCHAQFNQGSDAPPEPILPPLNVWMQCWYLMGCTDSLSYIAAKLNIELSIIESMVQVLQKIFQIQKPQTGKLTLEEWLKESQGLSLKLSEALLKQQETLNANIATAPKDSTEFRRQQNLRRTLGFSTDPTAASRPSTGQRKR